MMSMWAETKETLGLRAGCAARCIMALNEQLDMLLSSLPADEGDEEGLDKVLEELCRENIRAGTWRKREGEKESVCVCERESEGKK